MTEYHLFQTSWIHCVHYKRTPLQGALEISNRMMTSGVCVTSPKRIIERPDLFANGLRNTCCFESSAVSTDIVNEVSATKRDNNDYIQRTRLIFCYMIVRKFFRSGL